VKDFGRYLLKRSRRRLAEKKPAPLAAALHCIKAVRSDYDLMRTNRLKYSLENSVTSVSQFPRDLVEKIGLQMMVAVRLMHFLRDSGIPKGGPIASRLIRLAFGSDVHYNAEFAPGINIIHGMGMAISSAAKLGSGCVLSHNVTLGHAIDAETRQSGAPILGKNVHLGPGATLMGPITVGDESKVMAGSVLNCSVQPRSLVSPGKSNITTRKAPAIFSSP
jgi:serine acetyltransferase